MSTHIQGQSKRSSPKRSIFICDKGFSAVHINALFISSDESQFQTRLKDTLTEQDVHCPSYRNPIGAYYFKWILYFYQASLSPLQISRIILYPTIHVLFITTNCFSPIHPAATFLHSEHAHVLFISLLVPSTQFSNNVPPILHARLDVPYAQNCAQ